MFPVLLILGASVRAAAMSAVRGGLRPFGGDLFADEDLRRIATAVRIEDYPEELAAVAAAAPPGPWLYTGGLENHPQLIDRIAEGRQLLGNPGPILTAVRDPFRTAIAFRRGGMACPEVCRNAGEVSDEGVWLRKPYRGSGGSGITVHDASSHMGDDQQHFFQRWIDGSPCAAAYVAARERAVLLGVTRQVLGNAENGGSRFQYGGSLGPLPLRSGLREQFEAIGQTLAHTFGLVGVFGVDAVVAGDVVWPIEINPRYTASVEVLERGCDFSAVRFHVDACLSGSLPESPAEPCRWCGKSVVYARMDLKTPTSLACCEHVAFRLADIPQGGSLVRAGQPVVTVMADGNQEESVARGLGEGVRWTERQLYGMPRSAVD